MIDLALYESRDAVSVQQISDDHVRVHLGFDHDSTHIAQALNDAGLSHHVESAVNLFGDDTVARDYHAQGDFVLISAK